MKAKVFCMVLCFLLIIPVLFSCAKPKSTEVITLRFASDTPEVAAPTQFAYHFMNYVEEKSGGRVKFERYPGGVLGIMPEMLNMVSSGAIDMTVLLHLLFKEQLPLHAFPEQVRGSMANAMDYINKLNFEIPETAALMEKEMEANNIKGLNYHALGEDGIVAKTVFNSLADLKGKKLGGDKPLKAYENLGFTIVSVNQADMYEALARGVVDALPFPIEAVASNKWYEVSKCFMYNSLYHGGWQTVINLNTWKKLPPDIQDIFLEAAKSAEAFSVEWDKNHTAEYEKTLRDAGLVVGRLPASDTDALFKQYYEMDKQDMLTFAEKTGKTEEAKTILKYVDQILLGK